MWYVYQIYNGVDNPELIKEFQTLESCFEFSDLQIKLTWNELKDEDNVKQFEEYKIVKQEIGQKRRIGFERYENPGENTKYTTIYLSYSDDGYDTTYIATKTLI